MLLTDGPARKSRSVFGGLTLIECDGLDEALKWAARLPTASAGKVEVPAFFSGARLSDQYSELFRDCWWPAVAVLTRLTGDLGTAEDAVQDACALALTEMASRGGTVQPPRLARRRGAAQGARPAAPRSPAGAAGGRSGP